MKKKVISLLLIIVLCVSLFPLNDSFAKKKIKLNKKEIEIDVGETFQLVLKNAKAKKVKWSSDDKEVATVNSKGVVKGISDGVAYITATYKNKGYLCVVCVEDEEYWNDEDEDEDESWYNSNTKTEYSFTSSKDSIILTKDKLTDCTKISLTITKRGTDAAERVRKYFEIDDPSIVSCEWENGYLYFTGLKDGKTTVKITNNIDDEVIIIPVEVTGFSVKVDISSFKGLTDDGFLFSVKTTSGLTHLSRVYFESVDYTINDFDTIIIDYKAYSVNAIESSTLSSDLTYCFTYKLYDNEGYVIADGSFRLPKMYVGSKVKNSFSIYKKLKAGESYRLSISDDRAY